MTLMVNKIFGKEDGEGSVGSKFPARPVEPNEADVLCGKTALARSHQGNRRFRRLVRKCSLAYQKARNRSKKREITKAIIMAVAKQGGRFLKATCASRSYEDPSSVLLQAASEDFIYEKVSHALRSYRPLSAQYVYADGSPSDNDGSFGPPASQSTLTDTDDGSSDLCPSDCSREKHDAETPSVKPESFVNKNHNKKEHIDWEPFRVQNQQSGMCLSWEPEPAQVQPVAVSPIQYQTTEVVDWEPFRLQNQKHELDFDPKELQVLFEP